ncbi:glycosyltransferase [Crossiella sp. NPDC003009]
MRVAVVSGGEPGHVFPAIALCLRLAEAGDEPTLFTVGRWVQAAEQAGIPTPPLPDLPLTAEDDREDLGRWQHERAAAMALALAPRIAESRPDLVVCDVLAPGGGLAAELLGLPWAKLSPHPLYEPSRGLPPVGSGLAVGEGLTGRLRDTLLRAATARSIRQGERQQAKARLGLGLPARGPGPAARLIATLPALEVPRPDWPTNAHVVGPLLWEPTQELLTPPPGTAPLVLISASTAAAGAVGVAEATLEALRDLGVRAVVCTFGPPPAGLPEWARAGLGRQDELLREAAVVVGGGGHGVLAKALVAGVPLVIVPGGGDQWELANRATRQGSALLVRPPEPAALRAAIRHILAEPRFAAAAARAAATAAQVSDPVQVCRNALSAR